MSAVLRLINVLRRLSRFPGKHAGEPEHLWKALNKGLRPVFEPSGIRAFGSKHGGPNAGRRESFSRRWLSRAPELQEHRRGCCSPVVLQHLRLPPSVLEREAKRLQLTKFWFVFFAAVMVANQSSPVHLLRPGHLVPCRGAVEHGEDEMRFSEHGLKKVKRIGGKNKNRHLSHVFLLTDA